MPNQDPFRGAVRGPAVAMSAATRNVWLEARRAFLPFQGVVGVGYGRKVTGGRVVTRHAIVVLVTRKLPRAEVPRDEVIPGVFGGLPTDVREPRLLLEDDGTGEVRTPPGDFCLTDHHWIDAGKIHRMRLDQRRAHGPGDLI